MLARTQRPGDADYYAFSFSGLKTAVRNRVEALAAEGRLATERDAVARSFQQAVLDVLVAKTLRAVEARACPRVLIGGGVAASGALRAALADALGPDGRLFSPSPRMATDNGAMIALAAGFRYGRGERGGARPDGPRRPAVPRPGPTHAGPIMMTILHISDLHFGPPYFPRVGDALRTAARALGPDVIVASGDFTQRAKEEQFMEARAYLDSLPDVPR
jgi:hypothetical protein